MRTISQVAELTGISTRTLQYYDEIDLLKPSELTQSGYHLYNDETLQTATYVGQQTDLSQDISSPQIQDIVHSIIQSFQNYNDTISDNTLINTLIDTYSSNYIKCVTDNKYGKGASDYVIKAPRYYSENN